MDILRYNAANAAVFAGVSDAAERNLRAAALRYGVKITCFAIGPRGEVAARPPPPGRVAVPRRAFDTRPWRVRPQVASADFGPKPGVEARTELFLVRRGDHFLSVTKDDGSKGSELFANVPLGEVVPELEERGHTLGLLTAGTNRTRRVPHPVLIGHAASLTPY